MSWAYLLTPNFQVVNTVGKPATNGYMEVYLHGPGVKYYCASDFDGTLHPFKIPLDSLGSNIVLADTAHAYDVYIYNRYGTLIMSRANVRPVASGGGGGGGGTYVSGAGIKIEGDTISIDGSVVALKSDLPEAPVQSDWTEADTESLAYIKNKPANIVTDANYVHTDNNYTDADKSKLAGIQSGAEQNVQSDWTENDTTSDAYIQHKPTETQLVAGNNITFTEGTGTLTISASGAPAATGVTQYLSWDGTSNLFSDIAAIVAAGNVPVVRYQGYDWVCTDSTNDNRFVFMSSPGEGSVFGYIQFFSGTSPTVSFKSYVLSDGLSTAMANSKTVPIIMYPPTSSDANETKKNRAAICRLDKVHSDDGTHTDNYCEFLIHLNTGATANGNANSSLSLHVLVNALEDGGPYRVDMRVTGNNNWDLINARPTIALADTGANNDGVIVFFGLFNSADTAWVDFEQTTMTVVVMNPVPVLLGNTDKVNSLSGLTIHRLSPDNIPPVSYGNTNECLCIDSNGSLEWAPRMRGILTEDDGQGGVTSSDIRNLRINTNVGDAGLVRVTPVGGSAQIIGYLAPDYAMVGDQGKVLRINSDGTSLEWTTPVTYTAGTNVSINNNVISATDTTYTAGTNLTLSGTTFSCPNVMKHDSYRIFHTAYGVATTQEVSIFGGAMTLKFDFSPYGSLSESSYCKISLKGTYDNASGWKCWSDWTICDSSAQTPIVDARSLLTGNTTYVALDGGTAIQYGVGVWLDTSNEPTHIKLTIRYMAEPNVSRTGYVDISRDNFVHVSSFYGA